MRQRLTVCFLVLAAASAATQAAGPSPKPGDYIAERGMGTLHVSPIGVGGSPFTIESVGGNFHTCSLDGRIVGLKATLPAGEDPSACVVSFAPSADGIAVASTEACQEYCGARARFDGLYLRPAQGCSASALTATRATFKRLYDRKQFAQAFAALSPVLSTCARTLDRYENAEILNDIAITGSASATPACAPWRRSRKTPCSATTRCAATIRLPKPTSGCRSSRLRASTSVCVARKRVDAHRLRPAAGPHRI